MSDRWKAFGTLTVRSHTGFAYNSLWRSTRSLLGWFALGAAVVGVLGTLLLRWMLRPLDAVVDQARAIGERNNFV